MPVLTFIDNTLLHRIGAVLESPPGGVVHGSDILAVFHFVEHILFASEISVSTFERPETQERTAKIAAGLASQGVSSDLLSLAAFSRDEYAAACEAASWEILSQLTDLAAEDLRTAGKLADESTRPAGLFPWPFHLWKSLDGAEEGPDQTELWGTGSFRYTLRNNEALRSRLATLNEDSAVFDSHQTAALTVLFRLKINQELARSRGSLYAPAPQRTRLNYHWDELLRYRLEREMEKHAFERRTDIYPSILRRLHELDSLPLPSLAIHFMRKVSTSSPHGLIEAACEARATREVAQVRKWLGEWEEKLASDDDEVRMSALDMLRSWSSDIGMAVSAGTSSILASIRPEFTFEYDQVSGNPNFSLGVGDFAEPVGSIRRRLSRDRRLLAAVSRELVTDRALGAFILRAINRTV